jgi:hypothetical protein
MTAVSTRIGSIIGGLTAAAGLMLTTIVDPRLAATGWLVGFVACAQVLVGSLSLLMIHRLTSGRWGDLIAPVIEPSSAALPLLILLATPLFISVPLLYPWFHHPQGIKADVLSFYLNRPALIARTAIALASWSALSFFLPRSSGWRAQLLAGLGLAFHAIAISSVSIDWYLSPEAPFTSSCFGASVAVSSLVAALAWAALWTPAPEGDPAIGDVGGMLLAAILGLTYIDFMAVLVIWYGDLPREEAWFTARGDLPWTALATISFVLVSVVPILALIQSRVRNQRRPLRWIGAITLAGLIVYDAYLVAPPAGAAALAPSLLAVLGLGCGLALVLSFASNQSPLTREAADAG